MEQLHIAYIAGFFDGEGCICINRSKDPRTPKGYTERIRVMVSQVNRVPLDRIKLAFGGIVTLRPTGVHELVFSDMPSIRRFLSEILPYLIVKQSAAKGGIRFCDERLNVRHLSRQRLNEIILLRGSDPKKWSHGRLAKRFGVSRSRITQLLKKREGAGADLL